MKAMLVLEEMPKNCNNCSFKLKHKSLRKTKCQCTILKQEIPMEKENQTKLPNCPLKYFPVSKSVGSDSSYYDGYRNGYNSCLEEILQ